MTRLDSPPHGRTGKTLEISTSDDASKTAMSRLETKRNEALKALSLYQAKERLARQPVFDALALVPKPATPVATDAKPARGFDRVVHIKLWTDESLLETAMSEAARSLSRSADTLDACVVENRQAGQEIALARKQIDRRLADIDRQLARLIQK